MRPIRHIFRWLTATRRRKTLPFHSFTRRRVLSSFLAFLIVLTSVRFIFFQPKEVGVTGAIAPPTSRFRKNNRRSRRTLLVESNIGKQKSNNGQSKSYLNSSIDIKYVYFLFLAHVCDLNQKAVIKEMLPYNIFAVNTNHFSLPFSSEKLGMINTAPNQPAERLINKSEKTENQTRPTFIKTSLA